MGNEQPLLTKIFKGEINMCGIVGYVGNRDCTEVLLKTLEKLEYRGYDSAGIAVFDNDNIVVRKAQGRLKELRAKMETEGVPSGFAGIGHTRWATHGEPSDVNSHPHDGGQVTIVHNGIIENYKEIKNFLIDKGRHFKSQTDTEVAAQLLDYYYNGDPVDAIVQTMHRVRGSFALGIIFKDFPDTVFAIRKESPLIVGIGDNESYIASDVTAILNYTRDYYLLEPDEIAVLSPYSTKIYDLHYTQINKPLLHADWDENAAEKQGYAHFMLKEIHEQPEAVKTTIMPRITDGMPDLTECGITLDMLRSFRRIHIVACGTAMHAGLVGKYVIEELARVPVNVDVASEFRYRKPLVTKDDLVVIVSQSGETADSLAALRLSKELSAKTLAIVNAKGSSIAREADMLIYTLAGPEISVASTKAYMVQIAVMYLLAFSVALAVGEIDEARCRELTAELIKMPERIAKAIELEENAQYAASTLINAESLLYIGRGLDYALSMEGSLKLKEISYIHSESYAAGELKHGTISLITEGMPAISLVTQHDLVEKTVSNMKEMKARGAYVVAVCAHDIEIDNEAVDYTLTLPDCPDILAPMTAVVPLQLIAYYTSVLKGNDVDKPRNLAKSVTVE